MEVTLSADNKLTDKVPVVRYEPALISEEDCEPRIGFIPFQDGDWVSFADYEAAIARAEAAERDAACLDAECRQNMTQALKNGQSALAASARAEALEKALRLAMEWNWLDEDARPSLTAEICDAAIAAQQAGG